MKSSSPTNDPSLHTPFHLGYRRWLDGLRGVAISLVLAFHYRLVGGGWLGVDLFFVLSGFLITALLLEEWENREAISLGRFYLRRGLRLLPAFYFLLLICAVEAWIFASPRHAQQIWDAILVAGCYVADYPLLHKTPLLHLGHTWSLSVEEQFYLLWPILLVLMLRCRLSRRWMIALVCAGIACCIVHRILIYQEYRTTAATKALIVPRMYVALDARADSLLVGCLAAMLICWNYLPKSQRFVRRLKVCAWICAGAFAYLVWKRSMEHSQFYNGLFTGVALMIAVILLRFLVAPSRIGAWILESKPLVALGRISYGLYLFHVPILYWLGPESLGWGYPRETLLACGLTVVAAIISYYLIERPCLRLKRRFERRGHVAGKAGSTSENPLVRAA